MGRWKSENASSYRRVQLASRNSNESSAIPMTDGYQQDLRLNDKNVYLTDIGNYDHPRRRRPSVTVAYMANDTAGSANIRPTSNGRSKAATDSQHRRSDLTRTFRTAIVNNVDPEMLAIKERLQTQKRNARGQRSSTESFSEHRRRPVRLLVGSSLSRNENDSRFLHSNAAGANGASAFATLSARKTKSRSRGGGGGGGGGGNSSIGQYRRSMTNLMNASTMIEENPADDSNALAAEDADDGAGQKNEPVESEADRKTVVEKGYEVVGGKRYLVKGKTILREGALQCRMKGTLAVPKAGGVLEGMEGGTATDGLLDVERNYDPPKDAKEEDDEALMDGLPPVYPEDILMEEQQVSRSLDDVDDERIARMHIHPCHCDIPESVRAEVFRKEQKHLRQQKLLQKRINDRREAIRLKKEAAEREEEQSDPDAFTDVIIATPEGMVRKRKRRKGPKKKKLKGMGKLRRTGKRIINWKKPPKFPVKMNRTSMKRKDNLTIQCRSYKPEQLIPWCIQWNKEPIFCWKTNNAFDGRECLNTRLKEGLQQFYMRERCRKPFVLTSVV